MGAGHIRASRNIDSAVNAGFPGMAEGCPALSEPIFDQGKIRCRLSGLNINGKTQAGNFFILCIISRLVMNNTMSQAIIIPADKIFKAVEGLLKSPILKFPEYPKSYESSV